METGVVNGAESIEPVENAPAMLVVGSRKADAARDPCGATASLLEHKWHVLVLARFGPEDLKQFALTPDAARALAADLNEMAQICSGEWRA